MSGTLIAQAIPILLQPVLKRLFTPEDFGVFDLYFRSVSILAILFTLRYERAIVMSRTRADAISLFTGIVIIALVMFTITVTVMLLFPGVVAGIFNLPATYSWVVYMIPLSALFFAVTTGAQYYLIRVKEFFGSASLKIYRRLAEGSVQSGAGLFNYFFGLPAGDLTGNIVSGVMGLRRVFRDREGAGVRPAMFLLRMRTNLSGYFDFPKYSLISNLMNTFVLSALTFQVYSKFSLTEVGYLELTQKILTIPTALIGMSIGQIILQRVSSAFNVRSSVRRVILRLILFSASLSVAYVLVIYLWGPELFGFIFGSQWAVSGEYARILILSTALFFVVSPVGQVLIGLHHIKLNSLWEIAKFMIVGSLFFIRFENITGYLKLYNLIILGVYGFYLIIVFIKLGAYERKISGERKD